MNDLQMIQQLHEEAKRPELHTQPRDYRAAVRREQIWKALSTEDRRKALALAKGEFEFLGIALEDIKEAAKEAA